MSKTIVLVLFLAGGVTARATTIQFALSPVGTDGGAGLSPLNEVIPGFSNGSGNEFANGISFDSSSLTLSLSVGYGSAAGFTDLTGPAFAFLLHGAATISETAPVLFDLSPLHTFAADPAHGGFILGSLVFTPAEATDLLAGLDYINIYTDANPGGEIRGQLIPEIATVPDCASTIWLLGGTLLGLAGLRKLPSSRPLLRKYSHG